MLRQEVPLSSPNCNYWFVFGSELPPTRVRGFMYPKCDYPTCAGDVARHGRPDKDVFNRKFLQTGIAIVGYFDRVGDRIASFQDVVFAQVSV